MNSLSGVMVIGLTGQTGAGKSTVSKVFSRTVLRSSMRISFRERSWRKAQNVLKKSRIFSEKE